MASTTSIRSHARKSLPIKKGTLKADEEKGIVEAIVATYDVDSYGEQIVPGAFADTIAEKADNKQADGGLMPWVWSHQSNDPNMFLGSVLAMEERAGEGLYVKALHDMEDPDSAKAFRLIKSGRVKNYSFAYDAEWREKEDVPGIIELVKIDIFEAGPTLVGVNRNTRTLVAKSDNGEGDDAERSFELTFDGDWTDDEKQAMIAALNELSTDSDTEKDDEKSETDADASTVGDGGGDAPSDDGKARKLSIKAGRVLSSKNESAIREAVDMLNGVLDSLPEPDEEDPAKAHRSTGSKGNGTAKPDDPNLTAEPSLDELDAEVLLTLSQ